jgi:hypothetical protein
MAKYGIDGTSLVFEITEAAPRESPQVQQFIRRSLARRCASARDFGTGRELARVSQESRDQHHQARRLVRARRVDQHASQALVRAIVQLADAMGITTVAEYVEIEWRARPARGARHPVRPGFRARPPGPLDDVLGRGRDRAPEGASVRSPSNKAYYDAVRHPDHVQARVKGRRLVARQMAGMPHLHSRAMIKLTRYQWTVSCAAWLGWGFDIFDGLLLQLRGAQRIPTLLGLPIGGRSAKAGAALLERHPELAAAARLGRGGV